MTPVLAFLAALNGCSQGQAAVAEVKREKLCAEYAEEVRRIEEEAKGRQKEAKARGKEGGRGKKKTFPQQIVASGNSEMVFPWPYVIDWFRAKFHTLQELAGVPAGEHFGLHAIRRTAATLLWESNPGAAQLLLGHGSAAITTRHYVNGQAILTAAVANLPQPSAFRGDGTT